MDYYKKEKRKFVRILIGNSETGDSGVKNSKTINVVDTSVDEVYNLIKKTIEKNIK